MINILLIYDQYTIKRSIYYRSTILNIPLNDLYTIGQLYFNHDS